MKRFNLDEFLWFIILLLLDSSIIYLIYTRTIEFYVGQNIVKYIYITIIILSVITFLQIKNVLTIMCNSSIKIRLIPIILALFIGIISINNLKTFKHAELSKELIENKNTSIDKKTLYEYELKNDFIKYNKSSMHNNKEIIKIDEKNALTLEEIRLNPKEFIGRQIEIHGFVCKENYLNKNQFIIGRIFITCCAADSRVIGIVSEYDRIDELKENDNINAIGIIESSTLKDDNNKIHIIPIIKIEKMQKE